MPHDVPLIAILAIGLALAFVAGFVATRLRLPPLIGYLLAGIVVGPFTPGFVGDAQLAAQLAEIGVILLMFGVGMHFSVRDLRRCAASRYPAPSCRSPSRWPSAPASHDPVGLAPGDGNDLWPRLVRRKHRRDARALEQRGAVKSLEGRIAVGWLVVEDVAMVVALVVLPVIAESLRPPPQRHLPTGRSGTRSWTALAKIAVFFVAMHYVGVRLFPWLYAQIAGTGSRELVTLFVIAVALGIAYGSAIVLGVSFALGAFFAGVVINESQLTSDRRRGGATGERLRRAVLRLGGHAVRSRHPAANAAARPPWCW